MLPPKRPLPVPYIPPKPRDEYPEQQQQNQHQHPQPNQQLPIPKPASESQNSKKDPGPRVFYASFVGSGRESTHEAQTGTGTGEGDEGGDGDEGEDLDAEIERLRGELVGLEGRNRELRREREGLVRELIRIGGEIERRGVGGGEEGGRKGG